MKWKWFLLEHATRGIQEDLHKQIAFFPSGVTLEPPEEVLDSMAIHGHLGHVSSGLCSPTKSFLAYGWHFPGEWTTSCSKSVILIREGKNKSVQWVKLDALCPYVLPLPTEVWWPVD